VENLVVGGSGASAPTKVGLRGLPYATLRPHATGRWPYSFAPQNSRDGDLATAPSKKGIFSRSRQTDRSSLVSRSHAGTFLLGFRVHAQVAELADALGLGSSAERCKGSSPFLCTITRINCVDAIRGERGRSSSSTPAQKTSTKKVLARAIDWQGRDRTRAHVHAKVSRLVIILVLIKKIKKTPDHVLKLACTRAKEVK
jgi:hypothetical protein